MKRKKTKERVLSKNQVKIKIQKFFEDIDWMFHINGFEKAIIWKENDENDFAAAVSFDEEYQRVIIKIYPNFFNHELGDQRKFLLHELCHYFIHPMDNLLDNLLEGKLITKIQAAKENEKATSQITNVLDQLLQGRLKYAQQAYKDYLSPSIPLTKRKK